jgi:hypothetical protein
MDMDSDIEEKFEKLKLLLAKGIITQEQYEKKKEDLVDLFLKSQQSRCVRCLFLISIDSFPSEKKEKVDVVQTKSGKVDKKPAMTSKPPEKKDEKKDEKADDQPKKTQSRSNKPTNSGNEILAHFKQVRRGAASLI